MCPILNYDSSKCCRLRSLGPSNNFGPATFRRSFPLQTLPELHSRNWISQLAQVPSTPHMPRAKSNHDRMYTVPEPSDRSRAILLQNLYYIYICCYSNIKSLVFYWLLWPSLCFSAPCLAFVFRPSVRPLMDLLSMGPPRTAPLQFGKLWSLGTRAMLRAHGIGEARTTAFSFDGGRCARR